MVGPGMAQMMAPTLSQAMDFELHMMKAMVQQDIPDEEVKELQKQLDADGDGRVSKADFLSSAKKALFDPNPPEEVLQAMEGIERALAAAASGGGPLMLGNDPGMSRGQPVYGAGQPVMASAGMAGAPGVQRVGGPVVSGQRVGAAAQPLSASQGGQPHYQPAYGAQQSRAPQQAYGAPVQPQVRPATQAYAAQGRPQATQPQYAPQGRPVGAAPQACGGAPQRYAAAAPASFRGQGGTAYGGSRIVR